MNRHKCLEDWIRHVIATRRNNFAWKDYDIVAVVGDEVHVDFLNNGRRSSHKTFDLDTCKMTAAFNAIEPDEWMLCFDYDREVP